jgi:hypothetical protein
MARTQVLLKDPIKAAVLAWLVPGLGHLYQGRTAKGVLYAVCILGLYITGLVLSEGKIVYWTWINPLHDAENFRLSYLMQFCVGLPSLPALVQATLKTFDIQPILWGFMSEPSSVVINGLHARLGKLTEVSLEYTRIAGLLNVLAIYDAAQGPANADDADEPAPAAAGAPVKLDGVPTEGAA